MRLRALLIRFAAQVALMRLKAQPLDPQAFIMRPTADMRVEGGAVLTLDGATNFRDIGGYHTGDGHTVKYGRVYRSGVLSDLTERDLDYLLNVLCVRFVCDLRNADEAEASPHRFPEGAIRYLNLSVLRNTASPEDRLMARALFSGSMDKIDTAFGRTYLMMVDVSAASFGRALKIMTDPANLPTVVHCTAGKDRTGITTALLLALLGVPAAAIIADYTLTNLAYERVYLAAKNNKTYTESGIPVDLLAPILIAKPQWIEGVLTHIQQVYGSVERYATTAGGLTYTDIENLRTNLLE